MTALLLLALALVVTPGHPRGLTRLRELVAPDEATPSGGHPWLLPVVCGIAAGSLTGTVVGGPGGLVVALPVAAATSWGLHRVLRPSVGPSPDPLRLAGGWELLAACLRSGLPVPTAIRAVAEYLPAGTDSELRTIADRLALGADPATAWEVPESSAVYKLARAARRSAHSGAALASVAGSVAVELHAGAQDHAAARGQRAGVLITGPLGLCFLPAFLALGIVPVVIGLASGLAVTW